MTINTNLKYSQAILKIAELSYSHKCLLPTNNNIAKTIGRSSSYVKAAKVVLKKEGKLKLKRTHKFGRTRCYVTYVEIDPTLSSSQHHER